MGREGRRGREGERERGREGGRQGGREGGRGGRKEGGREGGRAERCVRRREQDEFYMSTHSHKEAKCIPAH